MVPDIDRDPMYQYYSLGFVSDTEIIIDSWHTSNTLLVDTQPETPDNDGTTDEGTKRCFFS